MRRMTTGEWLKAAREDAAISLREAAYLVRGVLPRSLWFSPDTIRRLEEGQDLDPVRAVALATIYGRGVDDLPAQVAEDLQVVHDLVTSEGGNAPSRCIEPTPVAA